MFSEKFPKIDPLSSGHKAADKILQLEKQKRLEEEADLAVEMEKNLKEQELQDREDIYKKDPDEEWFKK